MIKDFIAYISSFLCDLLKNYYSYIGKPCRKSKILKCHKTCGKTNETVPCCQIQNQSETEQLSVKL